EAGRGHPGSRSSRDAWPSSYRSPLPRARQDGGGCHEDEDPLRQLALRGIHGASPGEIRTAPEERRDQAEPAGAAHAGRAGICGLPAGPGAPQRGADEGTNLSPGPTRHHPQELTALNASKADAILLELKGTT